MTIERAIPVGLFILSLVLTGIANADPTTLGLPPVAFAWLMLLQPVIVGAQAFTQPVHKNGNGK